MNICLDKKLQPLVSVAKSPYRMLTTRWLIEEKPLIRGEDHLVKEKSTTSLCGVSCSTVSLHDLEKNLLREGILDSGFCFQCVVLYREGYVGTSYANLSQGYESPKKSHRDPKETTHIGYYVSLLHNKQRGTYYLEEWTGRYFERHHLSEVNVKDFESIRTSPWSMVGKDLYRMSIRPTHVLDVDDISDVG